MASGSRSQRGSTLPTTSRQTVRSDSNWARRLWLYIPVVVAVVLVNVVILHHWSHSAATTIDNGGASERPATSLLKRGMEKAQSLQTELSSLLHSGNSQDPVRHGAQPQEPPAGVSRNGPNLNQDADHQQQQQRQAQEPEPVPQKSLQGQHQQQQQQQQQEQQQAQADSAQPQERVSPGRPKRRGGPPYVTYQPVDANGPCMTPPDQRDLEQQPVLIYEPHGRSAEDDVKCPIPCRWTNSRQFKETSDGVGYWILNDFEVPPPKRERLCPNQIHVLMSMESEINYHKMVLAREGKSTYDWSASYRLDTEVPLPYFSYAEYNFFSEPPLPKPPASETGAVAVSFISNCGPQKRLNFIRELSKVVNVHNYGRCLRNVEIRGRPEKPDIFRRYKFSLGFENSETKDYATEKLYTAYDLGIVPITLGPPNVDELVPHPHSFIDANKFESAQALGEYLKYLDSNDTAYAEYFAWKKTGMVRSFERKIDMSLLHSRCRLCIRLANKDYRDFIPQVKERWIREGHFPYVGPGVLPVEEDDYDSSSDNGNGAAKAADS